MYARALYPWHQCVGYYLHELLFNDDWRGSVRLCVWRRLFTWCCKMNCLLSDIHMYVDQNCLRACFTLNFGWLADIHRCIDRGIVPFSPRLTLLGEPDPLATLFNPLPASPAEGAVLQEKYWMVYNRKWAKV